MLTRRQSFKLMGGAATAAALAGCAAERTEASAATLLPPERKWLALLGEGLPEERDYMAEIEGRLPDGLSGTLYRNGPGLFERAGFKKRTLLDGDGLVRATSFADGKARFRCRFVRTAKYSAEQTEGAFLYPTWTSPAPEFFQNVPCIPRHSQAGITPVVKGGLLYTFDELGRPWSLDPASLDTGAEIDPYDGAPETGPANYKALTKTDGISGNWILVGERGRMSPDLHVVVKDAGGRQIRHTTIPSPRGSAYFHDFFWADPFVVFHLHPAMLSPLPMLAGLRPYADCLDWQPEQGSLLFVVDTTETRPPLALEVPATWMWHALNAYMQGGVIVADFIGYDAPDHFLGPTAAFRAIMEGRDGIATASGKLRRFTIDLAGKRARLETIADGHFEFPTIPLQRTGLHHRYGYAAAQGTPDQGWFHDGVARIDTGSGGLTRFHFGAGHYVGEPVFVPDPAAPIDPGLPGDRGWLIAEVLDGRSGQSFLAIFDATRIEDGPIAKVVLRHHLPFSFHGWWAATA